MALTDTEVRNSRPKANPYKLADSGGLFLAVMPAGGEMRTHGVSPEIASNFDCLPEHLLERAGRFGCPSGGKLEHRSHLQSSQIPSN
jgi:hypothetical protein